MKVLLSVPFLFFVLWQAQVFNQCIRFYLCVIIVIIVVCIPCPRGGVNLFTMISLSSFIVLLVLFSISFML